MKKIDVRASLRSKYKGYIPGFVFRWLEKLIHQDQLNEAMMLQDYVGGVEFAQKVLKHFDITAEIIGKDRLPSPDKRCFFVSNHPLGGADGIVLTSLLGQIYDGNISVMVNDLLMAVYQFGDVFLPVNKYGKQAREAAQLMNDALNSDNQMVSFPAGMCSRKGNDGVICDLTWNPSFIRMAQKSQRDIVPLYFEAENSAHFYKWARRRKRLGIKFNYELILLPDELIRAKGKHFRIFVGESIPVQELPTGKAIRELANSVRDQLYSYPDKYSLQK